MIRIAGWILFFLGGALFLFAPGHRVESIQARIGLGTMIVSMLINSIASLVYHLRQSAARERRIDELKAERHGSPPDDSPPEPPNPSG